MCFPLTRRRTSITSAGRCRCMLAVHDARRLVRLGLELQSARTSEENPGPGTSWLWIGHGVAGVFRSSRSKRSRFFQGVADDEHWHLTDVQPWHLPSEAVVAVLRNGSTVSELISPADQRRVLQFPKLMASGDVLGIEGGCWSRCAQGLAAGAAGGHRRRGSCCHGPPRPQRC